ncbi:permuted papain-like amidase YaeF/Yiix C92 family enzyme [Chitinophaga skermanii]|uniref:Permuted papain-like amidase YaeF/Yiix C92 family enzyme n=1 Tax=Chitinophaga skermanii TaxID=331697 RepID=A0A327QDZ1_9BACT|nr:YiiX family permuted papain-like enzyme [Chitinophaga skermanii]RAJ01493.1 permuted papain-like amidase YaeF/Yiix C92 family enzyme [Chitinophaga skermanii]
MKRIKLLAGFLVVMLFGCFVVYKATSMAVIPIKKATSLQHPVFHDGDIVFQSNISPQCKAIEMATHSPYSHCGMLYNIEGKWMVYEAVQPVSSTTFEEWIARSNGKYAVKRLKNAATVLTPEVMKNMHRVALQYNGKDYDAYFEWSNDRIYCSELVWKIYKELTGLELGTLQRLEEFDLSSPLVKKELERRYGKNIPFKELVISPARIYECNLLEDVK